MNSTSALEVIIHPLCPGPGPATFDVTFAVRAELLMYASRSATRCSNVGSTAAGGCAAVSVAGAGACAHAETLSSHAVLATSNERINLGRRKFMDEYLA